MYECTYVCAAAATNRGIALPQRICIRNEFELDWTNEQMDHNLSTGFTFIVFILLSNGQNSNAFP